MANISNSAAVNTFKKVMGIEIELTIRAVKTFTISFDGQNEAAVAKLKTYLGNTVTIESIEYDEECDQTCIYFKAK